MTTSVHLSKLIIFEPIHFRAVPGVSMTLKYKTVNYLRKKKKNRPFLFMIAALGCGIFKIRASYRLPINDLSLNRCVDVAQPKLVLPFKNSAENL